MDTSNWVTHCVGRYLITLPPSAKVELFSNIFGEEIKWRKDLTPDTARQEAQAEIEKLKATPNKKKPMSMFIDSFELENGGICIVHWKDTYSIALASLHCYFITPGDNARIFEFTHQFSPDRIQSARDKMIYLATTLRSRNDWDSLPTGPGFCFDGGISTHTGDWRSERARARITIPQYPRITFRLMTWNSGAPDKPLLQGAEETTAQLLAVGIKVVRRGDVHIHDGTAQERCLIDRTDTRHQPHYDFEMMLPEIPTELAHPYVDFKMYDDADKYGEQESFRSDAEALGIWDAISRSIRLRPGAV